MSDDLFSFAHLTEGDHHALGYAYEWLRKKAEEWYIHTRRVFGDARLALDVMVLKPICGGCDYSLLGRGNCAERTLTRHGEPDLGILLPEEVIPERVRFYDGSTHCIHLLPPTVPYADPHIVKCSLCGQQVSSKDGGDIISV